MHGTVRYPLGTLNVVLISSHLTYRTKTLARRYKQFVANSLDLEKYPRNWDGGPSADGAPFNPY